MKILQRFPQLEELGIHDVNRVYWQMNTPQLYEEAVQRHEGFVAHLGPLVVRTGNYTGLSHQDRYFVREPLTQQDISWGEMNRPFATDEFDRLLERMAVYFRGLDVFVQDCGVRVDQEMFMPVRVITETAWHNLFARTTFFHIAPDELADFVPEFTVIHAPGFRAVPTRDGTHSDVFIIVHLSRRLILIGGTSYAGEIKKAVFSALNYLLPKKHILPLLAAANQGERNDVALFLGHSGTGKSALAADPTRKLLGDSEHGWGSEGVFNIERGCYPKIIGVTEKESPEIYETTRRFGTILENVTIDVNNRLLNLTNDALTSNSRAAFPMTHLVNTVEEGVGHHPDHIFLVTMDVFGVLPPISKLSPEQAHYHFLSGYTGELVQNRYGETEPRAAFGAGYGAPFMPLHPGEYAELFLNQIRTHKPQVWLLNTGWVEGVYGVAPRIKLAHTRAIVRAVLEGKLDDVEYIVEPYFRLMIPKHCPDVPDKLLNPRLAWKNEAAYEEQAGKLVSKFDRNYSQYHNEVNPELHNVHPDVG